MYKLYQGENSQHCKSNALIKFKLALKVQLQKKSPDGTEEFTDPVLRNKQEALLQAQRNQRGSKQSHPSPPGDARKMDTERVGVGGRQSESSREYDSHLLMQAISKVEGKVSCIPNNTEKYISFLPGAAALY